MMPSVFEEMVDVKRGETMANVVEASASTARPKKLKKRQRRVRQQQQEGTEPNKGTVKERKRASPADSRRTNI